MRQFTPLIVMIVLIVGPASKVLAEAVPLSILSWNVWFDDASGDKRYPNIVRELSATSPDIIFLQEITPMFAQLLSRSQELNAYNVFFSQDAKRSYGQAYLTRNQLLMIKEYTLNSKYSRDAFFGLYAINSNKAIILINVHLESGLFESEARAKQVKQITTQFLPSFKNIVVAEFPSLEIISTIWSGDFNMGYKEFPDGIEGFIDSAKVFKDNSPTYHIDGNRLANYTASWLEDSGRLDRILIFNNEALHLKDYRVMNAPRFAAYSDHYPIHTLIDVHKH